MIATSIDTWLSRAGRGIGVLSMALALQSCATDFGAGFHLPLGDADRGREAFVDLRCAVCHQIKGFDAPTPVVAETRVWLGGPTLRIKTYGDLFTAIVNPSHRLARDYPPEDIAIDGQSVMSLIYLNEVMTVQQVVDLVAFLENEYEVVPPPVHWDTYRESATSPSAPLSPPKR